MKHKITWKLAAIFCLCVFVLTGCKNTNTPEQTAGAWTVSTESVTPLIPEEAKEAFDAAVTGLTGVGYEPIAYLGSQVVAGSNYGFLCRATTVSAQAETKLCTVKVYRDLSGNSSILDTKDIVISDYVKDGELSFTPGNLAGGWSLPEDTAAAALPDNVQAAFDKATAGMTGVGYHPLAYLGSQVVAGCNYAVLCNAISLTAEPQSALAVITIYADLEGGAQITSVSGFDFP